MLSENAFGVVAYPVVGLALLVLAVLRKPSRPRVFCLALLAVYAIEAIKVTLFPIPVDGVIAQDFSVVPFWTFANWVPIRDLLNDTADRVQALRNVLVGIPLGFGAWFVLRKSSVLRVAALGLMASLAIETSQVLVGLWVGFMYRVVDVNDVLLNTTGVVIGILLFLGFSTVFRIVDGLVGRPDGPCWSYIRLVVESHRTESPGEGSNVEATAVECATQVQLPRE